MSGWKIGEPSLKIDLTKDKLTIETRDAHQIYLLCKLIEYADGAFEFLYDEGFDGLTHECELGDAAIPPIQQALSEAKRKSGQYLMDSLYYEYGNEHNNNYGKRLHWHPISPPTGTGRASVGV